MKNKHIITISVGDWSRDGHKLSEDFLIKASIDNLTLRELYHDAVESTGFDFCNEICSSYGDNYITNEQIEQLGFLELSPILDNPKNFIESGSLLLSCEGLINLLIGFIHIHGGLEFSYEVLQKDAHSFHYFGCDSKNRYIPALGYGLLEDV